MVMLDTKRSHSSSTVFFRTFLLLSISFLLHSSGVKGAETDKLSNCRDMLEKDGKKIAQIQWELDPDDKTSIRFKLSGQIKDTEYVALGISAVNKTQMIGSDAVVAYCTDSCKEFHAIDYHLTGKDPCSETGAGACPDTKSSGTGTGTNDVTLIKGSRTNEVTTVLYKRPLKATEEGRDQSLDVDEVNIFAAIGPLNDKTEVGYHSIRTAEDVKINPKGTADFSCTVLVDGSGGKTVTEPGPTVDKKGGSSSLKISFILTFATFGFFISSFTL